METKSFARYTFSSCFNCCCGTCIIYMYVVCLLHFVIDLFVVLYILVLSFICNSVYISWNGNSQTTTKPYEIMTRVINFSLYVNKVEIDKILLKFVGRKLHPCIIHAGLNYIKLLDEVFQQNSHRLAPSAHPPPAIKLKHCVLMKYTMCSQLRICIQYISCFQTSSGRNE